MFTLGANKRIFCKIGGYVQGLVIAFETKEGKCATK